MQEIELHASGSETANGQSTGFTVLEGSGVAFLDVTAQSGTTPTLDVKFQAYDPSSDSWFDTGDAFAQIGGAIGSERLELLNLVDHQIRIAWTLGGSTPNYTFSVGLQTK